MHRRAIAARFGLAVIEAGPVNDHAISAADSAPQSSLVEQRLFEFSPLGTVGTAIAIFVVLLGSFEICATLAHYALKDQLSFDPHEGGWPATILSLLLAVSLGLQRYARLKDEEDAPALARILPRDPDEVTVDPVARAKVRTASFLGAAIGALATFLIVAAGVRTGHFLVFAWFVVVDALVCAMFARGAVFTKYSAIGFARRVDRHLKVDLLRVDDLSIIGRSSARVALIWLCAAAVVCLFFASGQVPALVIATVIMSVGIGIWIFFRSLSHVHCVIRDAKRAELDRVRRAIAAFQQQAEHDHTAAVRLHGLIAYETRIEAVHEWPFDQLTLMRMGAYALIPAVPSLGQIFMTHFAGRL